MTTKALLYENVECKIKKIIANIAIRYESF